MLHLALHLVEAVPGETHIHDPFTYCIITSVISQPIRIYLTVPTLTGWLALWPDCLYILKFSVCLLIRLQWWEFTTLSVRFFLTTGSQNTSCIFLHSALEVVFSLWPPTLRPAPLPSIHSFPLAKHVPFQPMESQTTAAVRQWSFCKYHWYICVLVSVCGSVRQYVWECVCVTTSHTTLQRLINLLKLVHITAVSSACWYTAATSWWRPVQHNSVTK